MGNLYNIVPPRLVVQPTNLTFHIITKMLQLFTSSHPVTDLHNIDASKVVISLLKILLGNIYQLRCSKQSVEAFSDGILRSILENLVKDESKEISKYAVLNMSIGVNLFSVASPKSNQCWLDGHILCCLAVLISRLFLYLSTSASPLWNKKSWLNH